MVIDPYLAVKAVNIRAERSEEDKCIEIV